MASASILRCRKEVIESDFRLFEDSAQRGSLYGPVRGHGNPDRSVGQLPFEADKLNCVVVERTGFRETC